MLGLPIAAFRFVQADTRTVKSGNGHGGARSMHMGGSALYLAAQMVLSKRAIAAHLLQADASEVSFSTGRFTVGGSV
jgi:aerobic carbon-monoxide dehydrogenase large subunit